MGELTELLASASQGDRAAVDKILALAYEDLHALAKSRLRRGGKMTLLDTTALVHECYLRMAKLERLDAANRAHFFSYAARVMRSIIVDLARQRSAARRKSESFALTYDTNVAGPRLIDQEEILRVHEALEELAAVDGRLVQVVEMRYFGGLTEEEIAQTLGVTDRTVRRAWQKARLLLHVALQ